MPQKLTTTACFIQEESSGGKQFRKHVSCFYAQGGNVGRKRETAQGGNVKQPKMPTN